MSDVWVDGWPDDSTWPWWLARTPWGTQTICFLTESKFNSVIDFPDGSYKEFSEEDVRTLSGWKFKRYKMRGGLLRMKDLPSRRPRD